MATILVADDNEHLRYVLTTFLRREGHMVVAACDGSEVSGLLAKNDVDVLLTDIVMPEQEGIQTIILARKQCPGLCIIGMSGGGEIGETDYYLDMAKSFGAHSILEKPFSTAKLKQIIDEVLTVHPCQSAKIRKENTGSAVNHPKQSLSDLGPATHSFE